MNPTENAIFAIQRLVRDAVIRGKERKEAFDRHAEERKAIKKEAFFAAIAEDLPNIWPHLRELIEQNAAELMIIDSPTVDPMVTVILDDKIVALSHHQNTRYYPGRAERLWVFRVLLASTPFDKRYFQRGSNKDWEEANSDEIEDRLLVAIGTE